MFVLETSQQHFVGFKDITDVDPNGCPGYLSIRYLYLHFTKQFTSVSTNSQLKHQDVINCASVFVHYDIFSHGILYTLFPLWVMHSWLNYCSILMNYISECVSWMTLSSYSSVLLSLLAASLTITKRHLTAIHLNFNKWFWRGCFCPRLCSVTEL